MKLSLALATLATMASTVVADLPAGFITQCCIDNPLLDITTPGGDYNVFAADPAFAIMDLVSGKQSSLCTSGCPTGMTSKSLLEVCEELTNSDGSSQGLTLGTSASGLTLSCVDETSGLPVSDAPWKCAERIQAVGIAGGIQGSSGPNGFYCGHTEECKAAGSVCGDPHFQTWNAEWYDFHGECDMTFLSEPQFGHGLGLDIQIRSKARYEYSFIESAAVRIGDDVLEVSSFGQYFYNGVSSAKMDGIKMAGLYDVEYIFQDKKTSVFNIVIGDGFQGKEMIEIKTFKDLVSVRMVNGYESTFATAKGMMGSYQTGEKLARDGKTVISDAIEFGMEWQVQPEEPKLFQSDRSPQLSNGEKCIMPTKTASAERRRLGETISLEAAVAACEAVDHVHHENCVYDIMATGDIEIAHAGVF